MNPNKKFYIIKEAISLLNSTDCILGFFAKGQHLHITLGNLTLYIEQKKHMQKKKIQSNEQEKGYKKHKKGSLSELHDMHPNSFLLC